MRTVNGKWEIGQTEETVLSSFFMHTCTQSRTQDYIPVRTGCQIHSISLRYQLLCLQTPLEIRQYPLDHPLRLQDLFGCWPLFRSKSQHPPHQVQNGDSFLLAKLAYLTLPPILLHPSLKRLINWRPHFSTLCWRSILVEELVSFPPSAPTSSRAWIPTHQCAEIPSHPRSPNQC